MPRIPPSTCGQLQTAIMDLKYKLHRIEPASHSKLTELVLMVPSSLSPYCFFNSWKSLRMPGMSSVMRCFKLCVFTKGSTQ